MTEFATLHYEHNRSNRFLRSSFSIPRSFGLESGGNEQLSFFRKMQVRSSSREVCHKLRLVNWTINERGRRLGPQFGLGTIESEQILDDTNYHKELKFFCKVFTDVRLKFAGSPILYPSQSLMILIDLMRGGIPRDIMSVRLFFSGSWLRKYQCAPWR